MKNIGCVRFDTANLAPDRRFATWASALPHYELALPADAAPEAFACRATVWNLGDVILTRAQLPEVRWRRATARIKADGVNTYNFLLVNSGAYIGMAADRDLVIGPGQIGCFDLGQCSAGTSSPSDSLAITFARPSIDRLVRSEPDLHGRVFSGPVGMLLVDYLLALERHLPQLDQNDVPAIARAVLAQFAASIETLPRARDNLTAASIQHRARRHIERHLVDETLTPARLADDLQIARSVLYRSFKPLGGIAAYIQRRRLETVRVLLGDPNEARSIAELAENMGFADASHLAAAFRRAYGVTPSELRRGGGRMAPELSSEDGPTDRFRRWTSKLQGRSL